MDKYKLQAGDMVSFHWPVEDDPRPLSGDHVGIVEKVLGNGYYQTIEGNVSDSVGRRTRYAGNIIGGIMPKYKSQPFTDVDESTPHYADIKWMKDAGIAKGYPDGSYRPYSALTRGDAAAFLHRLYDKLK